MSELSTVMQGSAIVNGVFAILYAVGRWIASRLQDSKCQSHNSCFQCESNLSHLQTIRETNQEQLGHLSELLKEIKELKTEKQISETIISLN